MGNDCVKAQDEDRGVSQLAQQAVGAGADDINDATLEACLGMNPLNSLK